MKRGYSLVVLLNSHGAEQLLGAMPGMFLLVDRSGRIQRANREATHFFGRTLDELPVRDVLPMFGASGVVEGVLESGEARHGMLVGDTSDALVADAVPFSDESGVVTGVMLFVHRSDDTVLELVMQQREREYRDILDHTTDVLLRLNDEGRYLAVLTGGDRLILPPDQLMGKTIHELLPTEAAAGVQSVIDAALTSGEMQEFDYSLEVDGREVWFSARVVPEGASTVMWSARDITGWRKAEEERRALEAQMLNAQKLESLGVLAGGVAHDFNNLLVGVLGNAALATSAAPPGSEVAEALVHIRDAAERAAELCSQLLTYTGQEAVRRESIDLSELVRGITVLLETPGTQRPHYDLAGDLPPVHADATQLRQISMNLVTNANEALDGSDGVVRISTGQLHCTAKQLVRSRVQSKATEGQYVFLEVADDGAGMSPEVTDRMFEPFFTTKFTGRGLGMAAVLGIVRAHDGAIFVDSQEGRGTTVRVLLPAASGVEVVGNEVAPPVETNEARSILIIDDDAGVRRFLERLLEMDGHAVVSVSDGREAIALFTEKASDFDLVILDLTMPGWAGTTVLEGLRRIDGSIPVILSSGYQAERAGYLLDLPGVQFLPKPYLPEDLQRCIANARRS